MIGDYPTPYGPPSSAWWSPTKSASGSSQDQGVQAGGYVPTPVTPQGADYAWGGYSIPSLQDILGGDPFYAQSLANIQAGHATDRASLRAARQRAITIFGEDPGITADSLVGTDFGKDINATTLEAARQATQGGVSTRARLDLAHQDAQQAIRTALARRGMLDSGELGYQMNRESGDYTRANFDAKQKLIDYLAGAQAGYLAAERQRQQAEIMAQQQALSDWLALHPNGAGSAGPPPPSAPAPEPQTVGQPSSPKDQYGYDSGWNTGWWR